MSDNAPGDSGPLKRGHFTLSGDSPLRITEEAGDTASILSDAQRSLVTRVGATVSAYSKSAKELLDGRLAHLRDYAPRYLSNPGNVFVASCNDGVVVRYEAQHGDKEPKRFSAWM